MKKIPFYGRGPVHLLGVVFCYSLALYATIKLFSNVSLWIILAFPAGIFVHDFVLFPLYTRVDNALKKQQIKHRQKGNIILWINYVRAPVVITLLLLLCYFPIILRISEDRHLYTGLSQDSYLYRWLFVSVALFAGAAVGYFIKRLRSRT